MSKRAGETVFQPDQVKGEDAKDLRTSFEKEERTVNFEVKEVLTNRDGVTVTNQTTVETSGQPSGIVPRLDVQPVSPPRPSPCLFVAQQTGHPANHIAASDFAMKKQKNPH